MVVLFQDARAPSVLVLVLVLVVSISEFSPTQASMPSRASGVKRSFHFLFPKIQVPFCGGGASGTDLILSRSRIGEHTRPRVSSSAPSPKTFGCGRDRRTQNVSGGGAGNSTRGRVRSVR
jgi:hypothetical protein